MPEREIRLTDYLDLLRRQRIFIATIAAVTFVVAIVMAMASPEVYVSTSSVRVTSRVEDSAFEQSDDLNPTNFARDLVTQIQILHSDSFEEVVRSRLGADPPEFDDVTAGLLNFTEIIQITVSSSSPVDAAIVADEYAELLIEQRRQLLIEPLQASIDELRARQQELRVELDDVAAQLIDPGLPAARIEGLTLTQETLSTQLLEYTQRADALEIDVALASNSTELIDRAEVEPSPVSPNVGRSGFIGGVLGLLLGVALGVARDLLRDRISGPEDVQQVAGLLPVLAALPHMEQRPGSDRLESDAPAAREGYRYLRTALRFHLLEGENNIIAVTSARSREGKSTTAINLARALAVDGTRVALIDCDLRRPSVHVELGLPADVGLTSVLLGEMSAKDAIHYPAENLAVFCAGPTVGNPSELLGSNRFAQLLRLVADQAELTIIDMPPVLAVADPLTVGQLTGGVVVVARAGYVRRKELRITLQRLRDLAIPILGIVVNDAAPNEMYADYEYIDAAAAHMRGDRPSSNGSGEAPGAKRRVRRSAR